MVRKLKTNREPGRKCHTSYGACVLMKTDGEHHVINTASTTTTRIRV